jgi:hypothetical protein
MQAAEGVTLLPTQRTTAGGPFCVCVCVATDGFASTVFAQQETRKQWAEAEES